MSDELSEKTIADQQAQIEYLRAFAQDVIRQTRGGSHVIATAIVRTLGEKHGLLMPVRVMGPCNAGHEDTKACPCKDWQIFPCTCWQETQLLAGTDGVE